MKKWTVLSEYDNIGIGWTIIFYFSNEIKILFVHLFGCVLTNCLLEFNLKSSMQQENPSFLHEVERGHGTHTPISVCLRIYFHDVYVNITFM